MSQTEHKVMPIVYASGLVGILTFSLMPLLVAFSSATLSSVPIAASVNLFGAIFLIGFCTIDRTAISSVIRDYRTNVNTEAQRGGYNGSLTVSLGLAVAFRSLAHACLFLSLSEGERVFAVILYELYPFILLMLSSFTNKDEWVNETRTTRVANLAVAFACFFGVAAAFLGNAKSVDLAGLTLTTTTLAAFAALFAACDNIFHFRARKKISLNAEKTLAREHAIFRNISSHSLSKLRVVLFTDVITRSAMAIIFAGIVFVFDYSIWPITEGMVIAAILGVLVYGIGTTAWQFALQASKNSAVISLWYLTPVFSITLLSIVAGDNVTNLSALGVFIVIFGNYVLHEKQINLDPIFTTGFFSIVICFMFYHTTPIETSNRFFTLIELASAIFAILSGFLLSQQNEHNRRTFEERIFILQRIRNAVIQDSQTLWLPTCIAYIPIRLQLMLRIVQLDNSSSKLERDDLEKEIYRLKRSISVHQSDGYLESLESWILNKNLAQNTRTDIIIWIMGVLLVWAVAVGRPESFVADLAGIFLTTGTIAVMLIIRDQKLNHSHTFTALAYSSQQPIFDVFGAFFVPNKHLDYLGEDTFKNQPCISEQGGKLVPVEYASGEASIIRWIMLAISIIVFFVSIVGIVSKHYAFI